MRGRKPPDKRKIPEAIIYVLRTGYQWKSIASGSNVHRYFQDRSKSGFFEAVWAAGLYEYDEAKGFEREWQSLDGCMTKAPPALESAGKTLQAGEKMGTKRSVLTGGNGLPTAAAVSGATVHDVKLQAKTLDNPVVFRPVPSGEAPQNLCPDAGYTGHEDEVTQGNCIPHIRPMGEEKVEIDQNPDFKARRWAVVPHPFVNRFRKLPVRFEKSDAGYLGLLEFAFSIIVWRNIIPVHKGVVIVG